MLPLADLNTYFHEYGRFQGSKKGGGVCSANSESANELETAYWLHGHSGALLCAELVALCKGAGI